MRADPVPHIVTALAKRDDVTHTVRELGQIYRCMGALLRKCDVMHLAEYTIEGYYVEANVFQMFWGPTSNDSV